MPKKIKLGLNEIKVQSFKTSKKKLLVGGKTPTSQNGGGDQMPTCA